MFIKIINNIKINHWYSVKILTTEKDYNRLSNKNTKNIVIHHGKVEQKIEKIKSGLDLKISLMR